MQGVKLVLADGVWWRCGIDLDDQRLRLPAATAESVA